VLVFIAVLLNGDFEGAMLWRPCPFDVQILAYPVRNVKLYTVRQMARDMLRCTP